MKQKRLQETLDDKRFITSAIQRIDPFAMSRLMLVEVWHERFPCEDTGVPPRIGEIRPDAAEFLGQVNVKLDLSDDRPVNSTVTLKLTNNPEMPKRDIQGTITLQYEWFPSEMNNPKPDDDEEESRPNKVVSAPVFPNLRGSLKVTLIGADNVINLCWIRGNVKHYSSPYCLVFCYPVSPVGKEVLRPACWRSSTQLATLNPRWGINHSFDFNWTKPKATRVTEHLARKASGNVLPQGRTAEQILAERIQATVPAPDLLKINGSVDDSFMQTEPDVVEAEPEDTAQEAAMQIEEQVR